MTEADDPNRPPEYERRTRVVQQENVPPEEAPPPAPEPGYDGSRVTRVEKERVEEVPPRPGYDGSRITRVEEERVEKVPPRPGYDGRRITRVEEERVEKVPPPPYRNIVRRTEVTERRTEPPRMPLDLVRASQIIWFLTGVLEALLGIRFLLRLLAANPNAGFAQFIYGVTAPFMAPFTGLTVTPHADGSVLEIPALIAMLVYALVSWGFIRLLWLIFSRP